MNLKEAYTIGRETGYEIGTQLVADGEAETRDELVALGSDIESEGWRQYSPFEFTAKDFNESRNPDRTWDEYERGVRVGLRKAWAEWS